MIRAGLGILFLLALTLPCHAMTGEDGDLENLTFHTLVPEKNVA